MAQFPALQRAAAQMRENAAKNGNIAQEGPHSNHFPVSDPDFDLLKAKAALPGVRRNAPVDPRSLVPQTGRNGSTVEPNTAPKRAYEEAQAQERKRLDEFNAVRDKLARRRAHKVETTLSVDLIVRNRLTTLVSRTPEDVDNRERAASLDVARKRMQRRAEPKMSSTVELATLARITAQRLKRGAGPVRVPDVTPVVPELLNVKPSSTVEQHMTRIEREHADLRDHPLWGSLVRPAKAAHPEGWLDLPDFLDLCEREIKMIKENLRRVR